MPTHRRPLFAVLAGTLLASAVAVNAQEPGLPAATATDAATIEVIERRAAEVAAATELNETTKATLAELYRRAVASLEAAAGFRESAARFERAIENSVTEAAALRAQLANAASAADTPVADPLELPLPEIEQRLQKEKAELAATETRLAELQNQLARDRDRPLAIRSRLAEAKTQLAALQSASSARPAVDENPELARARQWVNDSRREQLRAEILMLEQELLSQPARLELLVAQRDLAEFNLRSAMRRVERIEQAASKTRLAEVEVVRSEARAAEREAAGKHPLLAELASRNARLTDETERLASAIKEINSEEVKAEEDARRVEESFNTTRQKLEIAGLSHILGQVLQDQRRDLPDAADFRRQARARERLIAETSLSQIQLEVERRKLRDLPAYVEELAAGLPEGEAAAVRDALTVLAANRSQLIDQALAVQRAYLLALAELDITQRRLQDVVERFDAFLDRRLLWVRSTEVLGPDALAWIPAELARWAEPAKWRDLLSLVFREVLLSPLVGLALLFVIWRQVRRRSLLTRLRNSGRNVGKVLRDRFVDTLRAFGIIVMLALPWPLLMLAVGRQLLAEDQAGEFSRHVGYVLLTLAPLAFQLWALRLFVAPGSVAGVHFGWRESGVQRLYRDLLWLTPVLLGMAFVTMLTILPRDLGSGTGLGRVLFLLLMAVFTVFFFRLSRPSGGTISVLAGGQAESRVFRLRYLWFLLLVGPPVAAAVVSLAGYTYTAGTMIDRILQSAWLAMLLIVVHQLILRWLTLNQQQLSLDAARARRRAEQESRQARELAEDNEMLLAREVAEPEIDIKSLDTTSRKLLNNAFVLLGLLGVWAIWKDVLPALLILDDVTLWSHAASTGDGQVPVTLKSLGLAIIVLVATVVATRQLPALLEIVLLRWLKLSQGGRYTVLTLTRYTVVAIGVMWIFGFLGGNWSEIQWIVAALGVGIGFGLQEIVANFISGLIILFERPIRIGDVVTVGTTDGVVTRIQIRATTIRNWDRKELLVPNKNFITQELLNWSLSDQTTRIMIRVGIAYGSDPEKALKILGELAAAHPKILADPAPFAIFEEFGDNALLLSLRCFIEEIEHRLQTISELNLAINRAMAEAGIEIAFPQRDVHLDTRRPLEVRLRHETSGPAEEA